MNLLGALLGSLIGAAIGGVVWGGVAYGTGYEIGWIAWGVGLAAGAGASIGARGHADALSGVIAVLCAVAAILIAKYVVVSMIIDKEMGKMSIESIQRDVPDVDQTEFWVSCVADQLISEKLDRGEAINWPGGEEPEYAEHQADYPADIWSDADRRWTALSRDQRIEFRDQHNAFMAQSFSSIMSEMRGQAQSEGFLATFGLMDIVFGLLAIVTAFKVGSSDVPGTETA